MKRLMSASLICLSFSAFAAPKPDCDFWASEVEVLTLKVEKIDERLMTCRTDLQCREAFALRNTLETFKQNYLTSLETFCNQEE
jgi:hypothetical protein